MKKDKMLEYIRNNNIDGILISTPKNIQYITNFECDPHERLLMYILRKDGKEFILCPELEKNSAKNSTNNIEIIGYIDTENGFEKLMKATYYLENLAVEKEHLTVKRFEIIQEVFKSNNILDCSSLIKNLRKYKSKEEIEFLQTAAKFADKCIEIAKDNLRIGITELELKAIIENEIQKFGINKMSFDTIVLFGDGAANPHGLSSSRKLKENEYVLLDLGCYYKDYASDITRCLEFGRVSEFDKSIYDIVLKANTEAIKAVKPGVTFASLDKIARDIITDAGYGQYFTHRLGHGLGMDCHEYPDVSQSCNDILEEGMVFTIEPGIYIPDKVGIRIEDDIVVTQNGYIQLTQYKK